MSAKTRNRLSVGRLLPPPYALAGHPLEIPATAGFSLVLAGVFVAEVDTPDTLVGPLSLLPLVASAWLLSNPFAVFVAGGAIAVFGASFILESANRATLLIVVVATLFMVVLVRVYAISLSAILATGPRIAALTPRELDVARLASQAYTAAEIGAQLHIGERTVETHLTNTYTKLRISSRRELIRLASRLGPPKGSADY